MLRDLHQKNLFFPHQKFLTSTFSIMTEIENNPEVVQLGVGKIPAFLY